MPVAKSIAKQLENASWIRRMFEEGVRLKRERGADAIFDFSLGNPDFEPPAAVLDALRRIVASNRSGLARLYAESRLQRSARSCRRKIAAAKPAWTLQRKTFL